MARPVSADATRKRVSIFRDPVVRALTWGAMGLIVLYLLAVVSALVLGVIGDDKPRTMVEKNERIYEAAVIANPADIVSWERYIDALVQTEQMLAAQDAVERALASVDESATQSISMRQAQILLIQGDYEAGVALIDQIRTRLEQYYENAKGQPNSPESKGDAINENYWTVLIMKAEAQVELGDKAAAIATYDVYLEEKSAAADVLVRRGTLKAETGDIAGAEADFRAALVYLPGDPAALEGLKQIGVEE
jgi:tetratricopeptide (TPR) repeat protein